MKANERLDRLLQGIEEERKAEEQYYAQLAKNKSDAEKIESGVLLTHLQLDRKHFTLGEHIEMQFARTKVDKKPHKFKVGAGCILIHEKEETHSYKATVAGVRRSSIRIILSSDNVNINSFDESRLYKLQLIYDDKPYRVMRESLEQVKKHAAIPIQELKEGINTISSFDDRHDLADFNWSISDRLNESQQQAVHNMLKAGRMGIIHGPPGTGKTTTLVSLVQTLLQKEKKILVCAPSNNAVDLLAREIHKLGIKVLRLGNVTRIDDNIAELTLDEKSRMHKDWTHIKKVKIEAEEAKRMAGQYKRSFGHEERRQRTDMYREARELRKWARDLEDRLVESILDESQVICTTLIGSSHESLKDINFETVIIDEASQALEAECWTAMLHARRVILAGDHKQLPPTVKSTKAVDLGLTETILDRMSGHITYESMLGVQYRMNDVILQFSNHRHYKGAVHSHMSVSNHQLEGDGAVLTLVDTSGCGFDEKYNDNSRSVYNDGEYFIVREYLLAEMDRIKDTTIGIIAPYADQVKHIRSEVADDEELQPLDITVNTVDGFQGQERDVIIISLVRSNDAGIIGFVADERRLNVAMTRARKRLIIVGDISTLSGNQLFLDLVDFVERKAEYKSGWEYMG